MTSSDSDTNGVDEDRLTETILAIYEAHGLNDIGDFDALSPDELALVNLEIDAARFAAALPPVPPPFA